MRISTILAVLGLLAAAVPAHAETFYCDPAKGSPQGDGSAARPWRTIQEVLAANLIELCDKDGKSGNPKAVVKPGDTVLLRSGWQGDIRIRKGYNDRVITIAADKDQTPQVGWIEVREGRKWLFKGLTVSPSLDPSAPPPAGIPENKNPKIPLSIVTLAQTGSKENAELAVEDCFIYSVLDASKWAANDWMNRPQNGIFLGREGKGHVLRNNYILNVRFGMMLCGDEELVEGNVINGFSGDGIQTMGNGTTLQYNVLKNGYVSVEEGDPNHDDAIQVFHYFAATTDTVRDVVLRGNIVLGREGDGPSNLLQGVTGFAGPYVNFVIEKNVVCAVSWHGVSLYDAQGCTIQDNTTYNRWGGKMMPRIILGQGKRQSIGNTVRNNLAPQFVIQGPPSEVKTENNEKITKEAFQAKLDEARAAIDKKFGKIHPVAKRRRLE